MTQIRDDADAVLSRINVPIFRALMRSKGICSVAELARRSGVHRSTIFRLLAGGGASLPTARALARALDTTVETVVASERSGDG